MEEWRWNEHKSFNTFFRLLMKAALIRSLPVISFGAFGRRTAYTTALMLTPDNMTVICWKFGRRLPLLKGIPPTGVTMTALEFSCVPNLNK